MKLSLGIEKLKETLFCLSEAQKHFKDGLGTDDVLKYMIEATHQDGWTGQETQALIQAEELIKSVQVAYEATKISSLDTWKDRLPSDLWPIVGPIAEHVDITKMTEYFFSNNDEIVHADNGDLAYEIESFMTEALSNFNNCGINISVEKILSKCDMDAYIDYVTKANQKGALRSNTSKEA